MPAKSFNERCYALLRLIPKGRVTTYKIIAEALGTKAYRAVGNAMAHNPDLVTTPCHRVVGSDGSIGGYALGTDKKIALLRAEGIAVQNGKIVNFEALLFRFESKTKPASLLP
jgi:methylated-DNA-[protein]-cysteine S-methyltransferase